jgi:methionine sulfoxide reductase heme-binding subunit
MSVQYRAVLWNRQKRIYDLVLGGGLAAYLAVFAGLGALVHPNATVETLLIRGLGTASFLLLNVILAIGPLCRLNRRFLPLLYNRRHLGVTMFVLALAHGVFGLVQFHALGDVNPLVSLLAGNRRFSSISQFPFQQLGFAALLILFLMAATSHDFWLHALTPRVWKRLHMAVYAAYALVVAHIALGALQSEKSPWLACLLAASPATLATLHLLAADQEQRKDESTESPSADDGFVYVCDADSIPEQRATVVTLGSERVAVFRYSGRVSVVSNVCRHQNGPLGEGRIIDGCITCPWHGYQYLPECGSSPPPFTDKIPTYRVRIDHGRVLVHPEALRPGTRVEPAVVSRETCVRLA